jgi:integrase
MNVPATALAHPLAELAELAHGYLDEAIARRTRKAYASDWAHFTSWASSHGLQALPAAPESVALYLSAHAGVLKAATLGRRLVAIRQAHRAADLDSPTTSAAVRTVWRGIRRVHGTAQHGKAPLVVQDLRRVLSLLPPTLPGLRDRALLLVGFAGAFRRGELVALNVGDVDMTELGLIVHVRRSKTDQEGAGREVGIPPGSHELTCPVRALGDWLAVSGLEDGPLFRPITRHGRLSEGRISDKGVARIVKRVCAAGGLDASRFAGHSLRAGLATSAAMAGVEERLIAQQTGHRSMPVLRRYIRAGELFRQNAAAAVGL